MLASTEFREERSAIFAHDISRAGVRLSGGNRTFLDVTRSVRCPSRGEELWKNTQNTLPTFWPASRAIWPRWGRFQGVFLLGYFAFRVAHRDNGCSHKVGPVRNSYASMLGNRSRSFVVIGWPVSMRARFVECGEQAANWLACFSFSKGSSTNLCLERMRRCTLAAPTMVIDSFDLLGPFRAANLPLLAS